MIYQKIFPVINEAIYKATRGMNEKTKTLLVFLCIIGLESIQLTKLVSRMKPETQMILGSIGVVLISTFCVSRKSGVVRISKIPYYFAVAFAIGVILISLLHDVGFNYILFAVDILVLFPFLYYVVINSDCTKRLYRMLSIGAMAGGVGTFLICIVQSLQGNLGLYGNRLTGPFSNPNFLGGVGLIVLISALYLVMNNNSLSLNLIYAAVLGVGVYYMVASVCRTALLAAILCILAFAVFIIKRKQYKLNRDSAAKLFALVAAFSLMLMIGMQLNDVNAHFLDKKKNTTIESEQIQEAQSEAADEINELSRRLKPEKDLDTFASGRIGLWKFYIDNFSFFGKEQKDIEEGLVAYHAVNAHNNIIEYYYLFGYIVGTLYLVFFVLVGINGLKVLFSRKHLKEEDFFLVAIIGSYAVYSMIEIAVLPFRGTVSCFFFLSIGPMVFTDVREQSY